VVIEWGEGIAEQLADDRLTVDLTRLPDDRRTAVLTGVGAGWDHRLRDLLG
jgi:tRNA threonylcarbamoyladenosine biosynthesis protein TsaE